MFNRLCILEIYTQFFFSLYWTVKCLNNLDKKYVVSLYLSLSIVFKGGKVLLF